MILSCIGKEKVWNSSMMMEGFYSVISVTYLSRPSNRKDVDILYILGP
jgi:hypothetical protein